MIDQPTDDTPPPSSTGSELHEGSLAAYRLAANMITEDGIKRVVPLLLLIAAPSIALTTFTDLESASVFIEFVNRIIMLLALFLIGKTQISRFKLPRAEKLPSLPFLLLYGACYWFALLIPLSLTLVLPQALSLVGLFLLMPALYVSLRFYFYFLAPLCGVTEPQKVIQMTKNITATNQWLALRALAAPLGIMLVCSSLALSFSPDGRNVLALYAVDLSSGLFGVLSIYTSLAFAFTFLPSEYLETTGLNAEKITAFSSAKAVDAFWLPPLLTAKRGIIFCCMGLLISLGNNMRAAELPPGPTLTVVKVGEAEEKLAITIKAQDPAYHFRSFRPVHFRLSGEKGKDIGLNFPEIHINGEKVPAYIQPTSEDDNVTFTLHFNPKNSSLVSDLDDLRKARDLFLWYRQYRISPISFEGTKES